MTARGLPSTLDLLIEEQQGALHLDQCREAGLTDDRLSWLVGGGRWQRVFPRVLVTFSGPIPPMTRLTAALLYAGRGAALCRESAGALWRLCPPPDVVHVVVPGAREVADQPGLKIHRSRTLRGDDIHPALSPRRTRIERTVCDLLRGCPSVERALSLAADAVRSRQTTAERLRRAVTAMPKTRWRAEVLTALPDVAAGAYSVLEIHDARLRRRHALPMGTRQFVRRSNGTEHLDVFVKQFGVHTELDGRLGHDRASEVWRDHRRDNASELQRLRHLRYGWADVLGRGCQVMIEQAVVLRQQGWTGAFRRCRRCPRELPPELRVRAGSPAS